MAARRMPISSRFTVVLIVLLGLCGMTGCASLGNREVSDALTPTEHLQLGSSYEAQGKLDLALREYDRAAVGPTKSTALTCQGNIHATRREFPAAEAKYRAALAVDPDNLFALNNLAWQLAHESGSLDEAEKLIRRALMLNPKSRESYEDTLRTIQELRRSRHGG